MARALPPPSFGDLHPFPHPLPRRAAAQAAAKETAKMATPTDPPTETETTETAAATATPTETETQAEARMGLARRALSATRRLAADPTTKPRLDALASQAPMEACRTLKSALRGGLLTLDQATEDLCVVACHLAETQAAALLAQAATKAGVGSRDLAGGYRQAAKESAQEARVAADRAAGALGAAEALRTVYRLASGGDL